MKRILYLFIILFSFCIPISCLAEDFDITGENVILYNLNDNTIIYGHTYQDKIMLSSLKNALDPDWYNEESNLIIELQLKEEKLKFEIFSIYTISETSDYLKTDMTDEEFQEFISVIKQRSIKNFNKEIKKDAKILTLSTCYIDEDHRLVVHAKLL